MKKLFSPLLQKAGITLLTALLLFIAQGAYATKKFVTPTGAGSMNGADWANAYAGYTGIAAALGNGTTVDAPDTVYVSGGTYTWTAATGTNGMLFFGRQSQGHGVYIQGSVTPGAGTTIADYNPVSNPTLLQVIGTLPVSGVRIFISQIDYPSTIKGFKITSSTSVIPSGYSSTAGNAFYGTGANNKINIRFVDMNFSVMASGYYGGAVYLAASAPPAVMTDMPTAFDDAGTSIQFKNCIFFGNSSGYQPQNSGPSYGGGLFAYVTGGAASTYTSGNLSIDGCSFSANVAGAPGNGTGIGGGAFLQGSWSLTNNTFCTNSASGAGLSVAGALLLRSSGQAAITGCSFSGNVTTTHSSSLGGAISLGVPNVLMDSDTFYQNKSANGTTTGTSGGRSVPDVYVATGSATITHSALQNALTVTNYNATSYPALTLPVSGNTGGSGGTQPSGTCSADLTTFTPDYLLVNAKVFLQGAFNGSTAMSTTLNTMALIPLAQPYSVAPFNHPSTAKEAALVSIPAGVTDWVLVELRDAANTIIEQRAGFVKADGILVDVDGTTGVQFNSPAGSYSVAIRHRNHLGIRTMPVTLVAGVNSSIDFTDIANPNIYSNPAIITNTPMLNAGGKNVMRGGDANSNGVIRYNGLNNDELYLANTVMGGNLNIPLTMYSGADMTMNGVVRYNGLGNDELFLSNIVLGGVLATVFTQHL